MSYVSLGFYALCLTPSIDLLSKFLAVDHLESGIWKSVRPIDTFHFTNKRVSQFAPLFLSFREEFMCTIFFQKAKHVRK